MMRMLGSDQPDEVVLIIRSVYYSKFMMLLFTALDPRPNACGQGEKRTFFIDAGLNFDRLK
jgi:hypothetical protein